MATTAASITFEDLAEKLKDVFSAENKIIKKYAEVWLSDAGFGNAALEAFLQKQGIKE